MVDWDDIPLEEVAPGITRQRVDGALVTLIRYVYQPGAVFARHAHPEEQTTVVLTGEIEFTIAGSIARLRAGMTALVPAGTPHGARVKGREAVETINVLAPVRREEIAITPEAAATPQA